MAAMPCPTVVTELILTVFDADKVEDTLQPGTIVFTSTGWN